MVFDDAGAAVEHGRKRLEEDPFSTDDGVLAYDGRITVEGGKLDAVVLELRSYGFPWPGRRSGSVHARQLRPVSGPQAKLVEWNECDDFDMDAAFEAFFRGVNSHEQGAQVWNAALDESK